MKDLMIYKKIQACRTAGKKVALATVVEAKGSTPRRPGAKMLVFEDGQTLGTVGGGCAEMKAKSEALKAIHRHEFQAVVTMDLAGEAGKNDDVCGGMMKIMIEIL